MCDKQKQIERLTLALQKALLWTDEEYDVSDWRPFAREVLGEDKQDED